MGLVEFCSRVSELTQQKLALRIMTIELLELENVVKGTVAYLKMFGSAVSDVESAVPY